jgi:hypothetical protein
MSFWYEFMQTLKIIPQIYQHQLKFYIKMEAYWQKVKVTNLILKITNSCD